MRFLFHSFLVSSGWKLCVRLLCEVHFFATNITLESDMYKFLMCTNGFRAKRKFSNKIEEFFFLFFRIWIETKVERNKSLDQFCTKWKTEEKEFRKMCWFKVKKCMFTDKHLKFTNFASFSLQIPLTKEKYNRLSLLSIAWCGERKKIWPKVRKKSSKFTSVELMVIATKINVESLFFSAGSIERLTQNAKVAIFKSNETLCIQYTKSSRKNTEICRTKRKKEVVIVLLI